MFCFYFRSNNARTSRKTAHTRTVQWFGDTGTNTSHLTVSFTILGKNSGGLDTCGTSEKLPTSPVQNLSYTIRTIMK